MQLVNSFNRAGAELIAFSIAEGLPPGWERMICSVGYSGTAQEDGIRRDLEARGIRTATLGKTPRRGAFQAVAGLRGLLRDFRADLLHTHCESPDTLGRLASLGMGHLHVTTLHNFRPWPGREALGWCLERLLGLRTSAVVTCAPGMDPVLRRLGVPGRKATCIPNGIDAGRFRPDPSARARWIARLGLPADALLLVSVGRVAPAKGHDILVKALGLLPGDGREIHLAIAGSTTVEPAHFGMVSRMAAESGLGSKVHFLGQIPDTPSLYAAADIVLLPSRWEGLSLAFLEAMASGRPLIASAIPASRGILPPEAEDWLVPAGDEKALAARIRDMAGNLETEAGKCVHTRQRVESRFNLAGMVRRYVDLYSALTGAASPGSAH